MLAGGANISISNTKQIKYITLQLELRSKIFVETSRIIFASALWCDILHSDMASTTWCVTRVLILKDIDTPLTNTVNMSGEGRGPRG